MAVAEFVFNGNANIYSVPGTAAASSLTAGHNQSGLSQASMGQVAAASSAVTLKDEDIADSSLLSADRQMELLLWLANLELRLPPYGDNN
mgnify:CR=1 FL=1